MSEGVVREPSTLQMVLRQADYYRTLFRRTWRGSVVSFTVLPILFLLSMGLGLGSYVDSAGPGGLGGGSYLDFIAPGMLATNAMTMAVGESTYPVWVGFKWEPVYVARIATPMRIVDVVNGIAAYLAVRLVLVCTLMVLVLAAFGTVSSVAGAVGAVAFGTLLGLAYGLPVMALAATVDGDTAFSMLFRLGVIPMTLFSGAFFPVSQMPDGLQWLASLTPVWHGVELVRACTTSGLSVGAAAGHVLYLGVWIIVGWWLARHAFGRRLRDGG
jgi:lipooligosaccharide transport system permease protein